MKYISLKVSLVFILGSLLFTSCKNQNSYTKTSDLHIRQLVDTVGFTQYPWQMDSIVSRIGKEDKIKTEKVYKMVINPHDDYAYAAGLYLKTLEGIKANTVVLIGVAHKARNFQLENKLVFGDFDTWKGTFGNVRISPLRDKLIQKLSKENYVIHDSMMQIEHSLEALTPFLQMKNKNIEIIPLLVPYFTYKNMDSFSDDFAKALQEIMSEEKLQFGKDIAIIVSNDAIHYGDTDWGGKNMAPFGVDSAGTAKVIQKEMEIIDNCLIGTLNSEKIRRFNKYTVQEDNFKEYKWTWCGRYTLPFGLMVANKLNSLITDEPLKGTLIDYRSSISNPHIQVKDIGMGTTAPANQHHWVGYVGISYE